MVKPPDQPHRPRKRFGQHWLTNETIVTQIVAAAHLTSQDRVLEIGPGQGVLTRHLLPQVAQLTAVEIDRDLCKGLLQKFGTVTQFNLVQGDILQIYPQLMQMEPKGDVAQMRPFNKVVANIPYNITGPILQTLLGTIAQPRIPALDLLVLLVQQEVAERLCAPSGTKRCGALTQRVAYLADCEIMCHVPRRAFSPPPQVESSVIRLRPRPCPWPVENPKQLERWIKMGFSAKRKMLRNNLKNAIPNDRLDRLFKDLSLDPKVRAEDLTLQQWITLSNTLIQTGA